MKLEDIIKLRLNNYEVTYPKKKLQDEGLEGSCWEGYEPIGMKEKDGKMVPNCVPIKENQSKVKKEGFPIPSPSGDEDEQKYVSRCISEIIDEYGQEQAAAICYSKWREK
jgi:hypothetical protein